MLDDTGTFELPPLTPELAEDDERLGEAADYVIRIDPTASRRAHEIAEHQAWLRDAVDADAYRLVLEIEARQTERWADLLLVVAAWAFGEGRRFPMAPGDGGGS